MQSRWARKRDTASVIKDVTSHSAARSEQTETQVVSASTITEGKEDTSGVVVVVRVVFVAYAAVCLWWQLIL